MIDLAKLTAAPWEAKRDRDGFLLIAEPSGFPMLVPECDDKPEHQTALAFAALARNAFDVQMRRQWDANADIHGTWFVTDMRNKCVHHGDEYGNPVRFDDPFSALVAADAWYRENIESKPAA